ncbi:MAG: type IX secretion system membrane protein PorP/SprF [Chlorobi bacterium]|nr:type IX secretion system membrane protein PorP/SprF [Chlorobiota bacterium]
MLKINYYKFFTSFLLFLPLISIGQQAPVFTHYNYSKVYINPASAGMGDGICINGIARQQWSGFKDIDGNNIAPQTFMISGDSPIKVLHGGIGGSITQDKLAQWSDVSVQLAYSFQLDMAMGQLGIGAGINLINRSIDFSAFNPFQDNDPVLLNSQQSSMVFDANLGLFYRSPDRFYLGVSATNILQTAAKKLTANDVGVKNDRTLYIMGGYQVMFPNNPNFEIEPSILIQSDIYSTQYNLSAIVKYNNRFWGGLNYRFQESIGVLIGMKFKEFRIGYSYDIPTLTVGVPGSHEIHLGYCFKLDMDKSGTRYKNTRYL